MKEMKLTAEQVQAYRAMKAIGALCEKCLAAENHPIMPMPAFKVYLHTKCPSGSHGVVIPGKPRLMAEVVCEEYNGWVGAVQCSDFRAWLKKAYNDTPESLVAMLSMVSVKEA